MSVPHFTLERRFNVILIAVWGVAAVASLWIDCPRAFTPSAVGAAAGVLAGILQVRSVRSSPASFARAATVLEVRRAFVANGPGQAAIAMIYVIGLGLLAVALSQDQYPLVVFLAGFTSFTFTRDLVALRAIADIERWATGERRMP